MKVLGRYWVRKRSLVVWERGGVFDGGCVLEGDLGG